MIELDSPGLGMGASILESLDAAGAACPAIAPAMAAAAARGALDLRNLAAPEPLARGLAAADALAPGEGVELLTPLLPTPLLQLLAERGFEASARMLADGSARVSVRRP